MQVIGISRLWMDGESNFQTCVPLPPLSCGCGSKFPVLGVEFSLATFQGDENCAWQAQFTQCFHTFDTCCVWWGTVQQSICRFCTFRWRSWAAVVISSWMLNEGCEGMNFLVDSSNFTKQSQHKWAGGSVSQLVELFLHASTRTSWSEPVDQKQQSPPKIMCTKRAREWVVVWIRVNALMWAQNYMHHTTSLDTIVCYNVWCDKSKRNAH